jgi:hypothetical protein
MFTFWTKYVRNDEWRELNLDLVENWPSPTPMRASFDGSQLTTNPATHNLEELICHYLKLNFLHGSLPLDLVDYSAGRCANVP